MLFCSTQRAFGAEHELHAAVTLARQDLEELCVASSSAADADVTQGMCGEVSAAARAKLQSSVMSEQRECTSCWKTFG